MTFHVSQLSGGSMTLSLPALDGGGAGRVCTMKPSGTGLWTVCIHPNSMRETSIAPLERTLTDEPRDQTARVQDLQLPTRGKFLRDRIYSGYFWWRWRRAARVRSAAGA